MKKDMFLKEMQEYHKICGVLTNKNLKNKQMFIIAFKKCLKLKQLIIRKYIKISWMIFWKIFKEIWK